MSKYNFLVVAMLLFVFLALPEIKNGNEQAAKSVKCEVDISAAPEMTEFSKKIVPLCEKNYPKIKKILESKGFDPPAEVKFIIRKQGNPGETVGNIIYLSIDWFKAHPNDDFGAIVHEMTHVVQSYPGQAPFWLQEGIADFIRYDLGYQNKWSFPHCVAPGSPHYDSGYWCSAAFLGFVNKTYKSKNVVNTINARLRSKTYNDTVFKDLTGKTIPQLWQDCLMTDCKGGTP